MCFEAAAKYMYGDRHTDAMTPYIHSSLVPINPPTQKVMQT